MTAAQLHEMVSKWPAKYREVPGLAFVESEQRWWLSWPTQPSIAAMLLCHHAEGVLSRMGSLTLQDHALTWMAWTVHWKYIGHPDSAPKKLEAECGGPTRIAAIDALIRQI